MLARTWDSTREHANARGLDHCSRDGGREEGKWTCKMAEKRCKWRHGARNLHDNVVIDSLLPSFRPLHGCRRFSLFCLGFLASESIGKEESHLLPSLLKCLPIPYTFLGFLTSEKALEMRRVIARHCPQSSFVCVGSRPYFPPPLTPCLGPIV